MSTDARSLLAPEPAAAAAGGLGRGALRRIGLGALVLLGLAAAVGAVLVGALRGGGAASTVPLQPASSAAPPASPQADVLLVHVLGAVASPGLYELAEGDRVVDAVAAAGGFTDEADQAALNLAQVLADAQQVQVPKVGEAPPPAAPGVAPGGSAAGTGGLVNLNTADLAALDTLPRIGPSTAQKILDWREANGPFASVDDLLAVSGIGEATLEGLRDLVTV